MPPPKRPLIEARRDQMFPTLEPAEVDRLRRFGEPRSYRAGDALVKVGEVGHGLTVVLAGRSEEHTSELQSRGHLVCRLLLEKKNISNGSHVLCSVLTCT